MTFFDKLKDHAGGLIRIKTALYWYEAGKWDGVRERVCLLLDALTSIQADADSDAPLTHAATDTGAEDDSLTFTCACVLLFIDGAPKWVWVYENAMEFVK